MYTCYNIKLQMSLKVTLRKDRKGNKVKARV